MRELTTDLEKRIQAFEKQRLQEDILCASYENIRQMNTRGDRQVDATAEWPHEFLMSTAWCRKSLSRFGYVCRQAPMSKTTQKGTVKGRRRRKSWRTTSSSGQASHCHCCCASQFRDERSRRAATTAHESVSVPPQRRSGIPGIRLVLVKFVGSLKTLHLRSLLKLIEFGPNMNFIETS